MIYCSRTCDIGPIELLKNARDREIAVDRFPSPRLCIYKCQ